MDDAAAWLPLRWALSWGLDLSIVSQFLAISTGTSDEPKELGQPKPSELTETGLRG
jgi:hypothetical protein